MPPWPPSGDVGFWFLAGAVCFALVPIGVAVVLSRKSKRQTEMGSLEIELKGGEVLKVQHLEQSEVDEIVDRFRDRLHAIRR